MCVVSVVESDVTCRHANRDELYRVSRIVQHLYRRGKKFRERIPPVFGEEKPFSTWRLAFVRADMQCARSLLLPLLRIESIFFSGLNQFLELSEVKILNFD